MATQVYRPTMVTKAARARWATVRIETDSGVYVGRVFVPETKKRLSDVLCDDRPFINLTEVTINGGGIIEPFVAVNKHYVKTVRVLNEGSEAILDQRAQLMQ
jgi:hypothetical protein